MANARKSLRLMCLRYLVKRPRPLESAIACIAGSGAGSKGEDGFLCQAAPADSVGGGDLGEHTLTHAAPHLVSREVEARRQTVRAVVAAMVSQKVPYGGITRHDSGPPGRGMLAHFVIWRVASYIINCARPHGAGPVQRLCV